MRVLSIDVGTSNTVAVLAVSGQQPRVVEVDGAATMPTAVYADEAGVILVGHDAVRQSRVDPARFEANPRRRIDDGVLKLGGSVVPVTDALAAVLRRVLDETVRQLGGALPDEFRLTHPAGWAEPRRNTLLSAARLAGVTGEIVLVPAPVAAAAHFLATRRVTPGAAIAVYDLGAGSFDVAVVAATPPGFTVLAEDALPDLGGAGVDQVLLEYVGRQVSNRDAAKWQQLQSTELIEPVRAAKETLSRQPQAEIPMPEPFPDVLVTRPELEALVRPSLSRSVELLTSTIAAGGVQPGAVYLVGGASRMPLVAALIGERLRSVPVLDQPETAVALGAHLVPHNGVTIRTPAPQHHSVSQQQYPSAGDFMASAQFPQLPAPQAPPVRKAAPKGTLVALGAIMVVALLVLGGFLVFGRHSFPSAADCSGQPGSPDDKGFTSCTRQLAGPVADQGDCHGGYDGSGVTVPGLAGSTVTCHTSGQTVVYIQAGSLDEVNKEVAAMMDAYPDSAKVKASWKGNGLSGDYEALAASGVGVVVFTVSDRPLVGVLTAPATSAPGSLTAAKAAGAFERSVQPGT
ncbi:Hsp70 family protein [Kutzneria buriramensis]|uniref:Hsp70 protein n=1 Tax=Kutzneria buriramensis TaxID=1045776 RepID=A0A3E0HZ57_9PSEU|nr:Hsp70 family protein [Kutzneria buriramensis]REH51757.1 Hsp70 protein [Kutzneria buriramensis]